MLDLLFLMLAYGITMVGGTMLGINIVLCLAAFMVVCLIFLVVTRRFY